MKLFSFRAMVKHDSSGGKKDKKEEAEEEREQYFLPSSREESRFFKTCLSSPRILESNWVWNP